MENPYGPPTAELRTNVSGENTSGMGKSAVIPEGVKGWGWGPFLLNGWWAIGNKTWFGLWAFAPYVGFVVAIYLGFKGRERAWQNKRWDSVEHFNQVQRKWSFWGGVIIGGAMALGILAAIAIPAYQDYVKTAQAAQHDSG